MLHSTPEHQRLLEDRERTANWRRWGPYLAERQWGTVREDYSKDGDAWAYFPHDHARKRAYRWGEDGLLGFCDRQSRLCFALALWNHKDPILKERLFGLTNPEGNHGEDVKEIWYYLDSTPTHSYAKALYKYPQRAYPYALLIKANAERGKCDREFEIQDTGIFDDGRYFDVFVEYAKAGPEDILIQITVCNRGADAALLDVLPQLWFRNTWSWGQCHGVTQNRPSLQIAGSGKVLAMHDSLGKFTLRVEESVPILFTENETNTESLYNVSNGGACRKDGVHEAVIHGRSDAVSGDAGTKCAVHFQLNVPAFSSRVIRLRLSRDIQDPGDAVAFVHFAELLEARRREADEYYHTKTAAGLSEDQRLVVRQAYAGLLWSKQYYQFVLPEWLNGDSNSPAPDETRRVFENGDWGHLYAADVLSMPDKWEYPWFAAWDLSFHMIPMAKIDGDFAKSQMELILREWYMHPSGQIPAYEWNFNDVNPPVHAWACWRVYKISGTRKHRDMLFLERCFQKLLLNFTWWVNRKDLQGRHIFAGGFLGLDNIGLFDRSKPLPEGYNLAQADGTAWMAFYCGSMLAMALELAQERPAYEDIASKFFEHFIQIVDAMNSSGEAGLWNEEDGFYYDELMVRDQPSIPLRIRSLVGVIPLLAVEVLDQRVIDRLPGFKARLEWFLRTRTDLARHVSYMTERLGPDHRALRLLAVPSKERLRSVLRYVTDPEEFLSPWGVRSLSLSHSKPYEFKLDGMEYKLQYEPGESCSGLFGGNSNWRGPIWFPINYLLIEALEKYHHFYGDSFLVEFPHGSGRMINLHTLSKEIASRLAAIFTLNEQGRRPCFGDNVRYAEDPHWRDYVLFHEYFHGDIGCGLGASHQTGWTALITRCLGMVGRVSES